MKAEGIIQQICNKYISNDAQSYEAKNTAYQIEQDLIAEIKKEYRFGSLNCKVKDVREFLIGEE